MDCQLEDFPRAGTGSSRMERARLQTLRGLSCLARHARRALTDSRLALQKAHLVARRPRSRGGQDWAVRLYLFTGMAGFVIFGLGRLIFN